MNCPKCDSPTGIYESRIITDGKRRRRQCPQCKFKFTTYERMDDEGKRYDKLTRRLNATIDMLGYVRHNITESIDRLQALDEDVM